MAVPRASSPVPAVVWTLLTVVSSHAWVSSDRGPAYGVDNPRAGPTHAGNVGFVSVEELPRLVTDSLRHCGGHRKMAALTNVKDVVENSLVRHFSQTVPHFVHIHVTSSPNDSRTPSVLYDLYVTGQIVTYVVSMSEPEDAMMAARTAFRRHRNGRLFAMPHRTQWLVIVRSAQQLDRFVSHQERSVFDNVAILYVWHRPPTHVAIRRSITLEWRENRTRSVSHFRFPLSSGCSMFPNKKYGMNRRRLTLFIKTYAWNPFCLRLSINKSSGRFLYSGLNMDILDDLSRAVNFSYVFWSRPEDTELVSWADYPQYIVSGKADLGLNLWPYDTNCNYAVTYPVLFESLVGYYIQSTQMNRLSTFLLCPFPPTAYGFLGLGVVLVTVWYVICEYGAPPSLPSQGSSENGIDTQSSTIPWLARSLGSTGWAILTSAMNQGTLPRPRHTSGKLVVGAWSLGLVVFYGVYTGYLTSTMVKPDPARYKTFQDVLRREEFKWVVKGVSATAMISASKEPIAVEIRERMTVVSSLNETAWREFGVQFREGNTVVVALQLYDQNSVSAIGGPNVQYIEETLFSANLGFMVAENSELNWLLSEQIVKLHESGTISKLFAKHLATMKREAPLDPGVKTIAMSDILTLVILVSLLLCVSLVILSVEKLVDLKRSARTARDLDSGVDD